MNKEEYNKQIRKLVERGSELITLVQEKFQNKTEFLLSSEAKQLKQIDAELKQLRKEVEEKFPIKYKRNINEDYEPPVDNRDFNDRVRDAHESGIDMGGSWTGTDKFGNS